LVNLKTRNTLIISFSVILIFSIGITSYLFQENFESTVLDSDIEEMRSVISQRSQEIESLHDKAGEELVLALKDPLFVEYFELPETKAGNVYEDGVLQFTDKQNEIKSDLEQLIYLFQIKFDVDETCIIDSSGQEHARLVLSRIAYNEDLSPDEEFAPFFEPSFEKNLDEVHHQFPYVSPDTERWVFAYTSPVVLGDGQKPAFFHFEMPITVFQELVNVDIGRMYVVDPNGFIIADSADSSIANSNYGVTAKTITEFVPIDYFPSLSENSSFQDFESLLQMTNSETEFSEYNINGENNYVLSKQLSTFGWILVYERSMLIN